MGPINDVSSCSFWNSTRARGVTQIKACVQSPVCLKLEIPSQACKRVRISAAQLYVRLEASLGHTGPLLLNMASLVPTPLDAIPHSWHSKVYVVLCSAASSLRVSRLHTWQRVEQGWVSRISVLTGWACGSGGAWWGVDFSLWACVNKGYINLREWEGFFP